MTRLRVLIGLLAVFLGMAVATNYGLYYRLVFIFSLILLLSYLWARFNGAWVEATVKRAGPSAKVGEVMEETVSLSNPSPHLPVGWIELKEASDMPSHGGGLVVSLPRSSKKSWNFQTMCSRRGKFTLGPLSVTSSDPLGIFTFQRFYGSAEDFYVYPKPVELPNFSVPVSDLPGEAARRQHTHAITTNAAGIRDYVPGDGYNRVHWRTTARTGKLMVKEFDQEHSTGLWLVLDMHHAPQAGIGDESTEEYTVTIAASIAKKYIEMGIHIGLVASGDQKLAIEPKPGSSQLDLLMRGLTVLKARGNTPLEELLKKESLRLGRYSTLVIITPSVEEGWLTPLQDLAAKRVKSIVVLLEAQTFGGKTGGILNILGALIASQTPYCVVQSGANLSQALDNKSRRLTI